MNLIQKSNVHERKDDTRVLALKVQGKTISFGNRCRAVAVSRWTNHGKMEKRKPKPWPGRAGFENYINFRGKPSFVDNARLANSSMGAFR